jgi:exodeoxyribonuclease VII small subunit
MSRAKKGSKETGFEAALERLERIVKHLEEGDLPLEESLRLFEEGVALTRQCSARLEEAQRRIEILTQGAEGRMERLPFDDAAVDEDPSDSEAPEGR